MSQISKLANKNVKKLAEKHLKELGKISAVAVKLSVVIAACKHGITEVAKVYDITRATLTKWIKYVKVGDFHKLSAPPERKRKAKLSDSQRQEIKVWLDKNQNLTIRQIKEMILKTHKIELATTSVYRIIKSLSLSYMTPRPKHYKQDEIKKEEFKKKSERKSRQREE